MTLHGLELQALHKRFGDLVALHSLDLAIEAGEFVSFLGPSGCGKTTALRIVAGFERPDGGRVRLDGKDITTTPANRRGMGMVFQAYSLFPNLTARENVAFGLRVRNVDGPRRARRAADLIDMVGLSAVANHYPHQLSGGQQQRVALARALAIEPRVLLLDEPLSALDATVRLQLRDEIRRIQTDLGITTLFVTHDQEEALSISDRVAVLSQGRIEQVGAPAEIYEDPRTAFVAQFIGTMNRIAGRVAAGGARIVEAQDVALRADNARDWPAGAPVLLLIRPEAITIEGLGDGDIPPPGSLEGRVRVRTFQGAVTRLTVESAVGELKVDIGSGRALALDQGARVALAWDSEAPRLIGLDTQAAEPASPPAMPAAAAL